MSQFDVAWACFYVLIGKTVLYIKKPRRIARHLLVRVLRLRFFRKHIHHYNIEWEKDYYEGMWTYKAFDNIENVYSSLAQSSFIQRLVARFDYAGELAIKKELNAHLSRFFYLDELFNILSRISYFRIYFIPANKIRHNDYLTGTYETIYYSFFKKLISNAGINLEKHNNIHFPFIARVLGAGQIYSEILMRHARMILRIIKIFFCVLKNFISPREKRSWKYAFMIIEPGRQLRNEIEGLDFLVDGKYIKKEEVVHIPHTFIRLKKSEIKIIEKKQFNYIRDLHVYYSFGPWVEMVRACFLVMFTNKPFFLKVGYSLCVESALWKSFSKRVHLDNVIGNHDVSVSALCRNIILEKEQGTKSWLYQDSYIFSNYFAIKKNKIRYKMNFYSFMKYNYVVCWNKRMEYIFSLMNNDVGEYYQAGCLWSTFIKRRIPNSYLRKNTTGHVIAVFDSSYNDYSKLGPRCAYFFYNGILQLLKEMSDIRIILKPKKTKAYYEKSFEDRSMLRLIDMLECHPRCEVVDCSTPRCEVIAQADLVIAFPFTSPVFEAVCAGVPAFYFDATGVFPDSVYHECKMIATGYRELIEKVKYSLALPQPQFEQWRQDNKLFFDGFLDGQALDRFSKKLSKSQKPKESSKQ